MKTKPYRVILDLQMPQETAETLSAPGLRVNKIRNGIVEVARLPAPGELVSGAKVGDKVEARLVLSYCGPITLQVMDAYEEKKVGKKTKATGNRKPSRTLQRTSKRR